MSIGNVKTSKRRNVEMGEEGREAESRKPKTGMGREARGHEGTEQDSGGPIVISE